MIWVLLVQNRKLPNMQHKWFTEDILTMLCAPESIQFLSEVLTPTVDNIFNVPVLDTCLLRMSLGIFAESVVCSDCVLVKCSFKIIYMHFVLHQSFFLV